MYIYGIIISTSAAVFPKPAWITEALFFWKLCSHDVNAGAFVTTVTIVHALIYEFLGKSVKALLIKLITILL